MRLIWLWTCPRDQQRSRSAGTLLRYCETDYFGLVFLIRCCNSSIHTEFSPTSRGKQAKHRSLRQGVPSLGVMGWPWRFVHAWETSCSWLKPLWWFHSAPPALVGIIADPQEVGEKPTQVGFFCTALLFGLWLGILLCHPLSQCCSFCCPWGYCLLLHFSFYIWALSSIWISMEFNSECFSTFCCAYLNKADIKHCTVTCKGDGKLVLFMSCWISAAHLHLYLPNYRQEIFEFMTNIS